MSSFLYRMVQRAAGMPAETPSPRPPRRFHWPALVDSASIRSNARPNALRPLSNPAPGDWEPPADGAAARVGEMNRGHVGESPLTEQDQTLSGQPNFQTNYGTNLRTNFRTDRVTPSQTRLSEAVPLQTTAPVQQNRIVGPDQDQKTLAPINEVITYRTSPEPGRQMARDSRPLPSATAPFQSSDSSAYSQAPPSQSSFALSTPLSEPWPSSKTEADSPAESLSEAIAHAITVINADAIETASHPPGTVVPKRSDSAGSQQKPFAAPAQRFDAHPSPPPVEVKIGSVEIVFDPPATASQPTPVRPVGFAEFAELRRYATRPWPSTGR